MEQCKIAAIRAYHRANAFWVSLIQNKMWRQWVHSYPHASISPYVVLDDLFSLIILTILKPLALVDLKSICLKCKFNFLTNLSHQMKVGNAPF